MYCSECGTKLNDGAQFCPECGTAVRPFGAQGAPNAEQTEPQEMPASPGQIEAQEAPPVVRETAIPRPPMPQPDVKRQGPQKAQHARRLRIIAGACGVVLVLVFAALLFWGPNFGSSTQSSPTSSPAPGVQGKTGDTWTVLAYLCGSNLESQGGYATRNITQLAGINLADDVTFVLELGGSNAWQNDAVDADRLGRYTMEDGTLHLADRQPRTSMGSPDTLADFLSWGVKNYPADHYMLVFWDHGGGSLAGVCVDELDSDALTLPELRDGIKAAGVTFEVVGFDTCLMATFETAQIIAPYAHYLVASEEVEPVCGWAWGAWPAWFGTSPGGTGADLGKAICDTYVGWCNENGVDDAITLSVIDLTRMGEVADAFAQASAAMAGATEKPQTLQPLITRGKAVESFGHANYIEGYTDMVDLSDLMTCMSGPLGSDATHVVDAVRSCVVYERHGRLRPNSHGLSVFYPLNIDHDTFVAYFDLLTKNDLGNVPYLQYIAARTGEYDTVNWAGQGIANLDPLDKDDAAGKMRFGTVIEPDGRVAVHIMDGTEWLTGCNFTLGLLFDDGSYTILGDDNNMDLDVDRTTGEVTYTDRFVGQWKKISDSYVYAELVEQVLVNDEPGYTLYSTPIELTTTNVRGREVTIRTNLLSMYDYSSDSYAVLCAYENADETGMAAKSTLALKEGDRIKFLVERHNPNGTTTTGNTGTITWTKGTEMTAAIAGDGSYLYLPYVTDVFGNRTYADPAIIRYEGGRRSARIASNM